MTNQPITNQPITKMYALTAEITIAGKKFTRVNEVEIESSAKVLEDTCKIKLPATARMTRAGEFISEVETAKEFKVGDAVSVKLGYNDELREEFAGFVSKIKPGLPVEIECVNAVWLLRRKNLKASFKTATLKSLIEHILEGTGIKVAGEMPGITFKNFYFKNVTAAYALQKLKDDYGLILYLNGNTLRVGLISFTDKVLVKYGLGENVIENDLEWIDEKDTRLKIKVVHWRKNNTKVEKEFGDADGEVRTVFFYDLDRESDLEMLAKAKAAKFKYSGFKGGVTAFLVPNAEVGNVARLRDPQFSERAGDYLVDKVTTTFGTNGARRKVELGIKVSF